MVVQRAAESGAAEDGLDELVLAKGLGQVVLSRKLVGQSIA